MSFEKITESIAANMNEAIRIMYVGIAPVNHIPIFPRAVWPIVNSYSDFPTNHTSNDFPLELIIHESSVFSCWDFSWVNDRDIFGFSGIGYYKTAISV